MKRIVTFTLLFTLIMTSVLMPTVAHAIDFSGRQSAKYELSNGKTVRIEYHGGKPHYHELDSKGNDLGSENLNDNDAHHSDGKKPSKSSREIVKGNGQKSQNDKNAKKKADQYKDAWSNLEEETKKTSKSFIEKNKSTIQKAAENGSAVVVIGGIVFVVWWLLKLASGWGILIPF